MKRCLLFCTVLMLMPQMAAAQDAVPAEESPLKTLEEKAAYGIGLSFGRQLGADDLNLDLDLLVKGIKDGMNKESTPLLTEAQLRQAMIDLQKKLVEEQSAANKKAGTDFLAANAKKDGIQETASGLQYQIVKRGTGVSPKKEDVVKVHYHGTLTDGTVFDSSVQRGEPAQFGVDKVIKGWTEALQLMKVGGKWRLFVPSELAYGERGAGPAIGPHTVLIFDVELLDVVK